MVLNPSGSTPSRRALAAVLAAGLLAVAALAAGGLPVAPAVADGRAGTGAAAPSMSTGGDGGLHGALATAEACSAGDRAPPTVTLPPAEIDATLQRLHALYDGMPGFVDVYFYPAPTDHAPGADFHPTFVGAVPTEAYAVETAVPVDFDVVPSAPVHARSASPTDGGPAADVPGAGLATDGPGPLPDVGDVQCRGIRPGSHMAGGCTASFLFTDGTDIFVATAGHCVSEGQTAVSPAAGGAIGTVVFSTGQASGPGHDFALVKVDPSKHDLVSAEMCDWAGPTQAFGGGSILGRGVVYTGHGGVGGLLGPHPPRPRPGPGVSWGAETFQWVGAGIPGDSGSAVRLTGGEALGTLTHVSILPVPGINLGTRWDHGLDLAAQDGIDGLELMTVDWVHPV